ncbi:unnamed protein product [Gongylonema pulchrum]|uniref:Nucleos_tra2_N domain-containing protein n=1 Tax=Gongylonema pulchrum TaxID=637853 RepID=A0A183DP01_9BILA|nr:unnamed protein product [Gongylonema pulchrum]
MVALVMFNLIADATVPDSAIYNYTCLASSVILLAVLLAQYGLRKELAFCLLPLILIQLILGIALALTLGDSIVFQFDCFRRAVCSFGNFYIVKIFTVADVSLGLS